MKRTITKTSTTMVRIISGVILSHPFSVEWFMLHRSFLPVFIPEPKTDDKCDEDKRQTKIEISRHIPLHDLMILIDRIDHRYYRPV
jgi:hypothetical protein